jgi:hypothetical protein
MSAPLTMARFASGAFRAVNGGYLPGDGLEARQLQLQLQLPLHDLPAGHPTGHERRRINGITLQVERPETNTRAPRCTATAGRDFRRNAEPRDASCDPGSRQRHMHLVPTVSKKRIN